MEGKSKSSVGATLHNKAPKSQGCPTHYKTCYGLNYSSCMTWKRILNKAGFKYPHPDADGSVHCTADGSHRG